MGTRLGKLTLELPKNLVPVCGVPFAHHQLSLLASQGVERIVYAIGHLGDQIRDYVGDGNRWSLHVDYIEDGDVLLGTGGAIRRALHLLDDNFLMIYGDSYLQTDYRDVWHTFVKSDADALMTVLRNDGQWDTSNVDFHNGAIHCYAKKNQAGHHADMAYVDYGLLGLRKAVIKNEIEQNTICDLAEPLNRLSLTGRLAGYEVDHRFYEVGSHDGIACLEKFLKSNSS